MSTSEMNKDGKSRTCGRAPCFLNLHIWKLLCHNFLGFNVFRHVYVLHAFHYRDMIVIQDTFWPDSEIEHECEEVVYFDVQCGTWGIKPFIGFLSLLCWRCREHLWHLFCRASRNFSQVLTQWDISKKNRRWTLYALQIFYYLLECNMKSKNEHVYFF